jgi:hypothetical protein
MGFDVEVSADTVVGIAYTVAGLAGATAFGGAAKALWRRDEKAPVCVVMSAAAAAWRRRGWSLLCASSVRL